MLILTRKPGQNVIINENIVIKILDIKGDQIKVGIVAPRDVVIHREEVFMAIKEANQEAAVSPVQDFTSLPLPTAAVTITNKRVK